MLIYTNISDLCAAINIGGHTHTCCPRPHRPDAQSHTRRREGDVATCTRKPIYHRCIYICRLHIGPVSSYFYTGRHTHTHTHTDTRVRARSGTFETASVCMRTGDTSTYTVAYVYRNPTDHGRCIHIFHLSYAQLYIHPWTPAQARACTCARTHTCARRRCRRAQRPRRIEDRPSASCRGGVPPGRKQRIPGPCSSPPQCSTRRCSR
jgi:hypothetical protein